MIFSAIHAGGRQLFASRRKPKLLTEKKLFTFIMRIGVITIVLLVTSMHLLYAVPANGQPIDQVRVRLELKNESLVQAFQKIEAMSNFRFMYRYDEVKNIRNISLPLAEQTVEYFLKALLKNTSLMYRQLDNQILILPRKRPPGTAEPELVRRANVAITVSGNVANSTGDPLVGVSIAVKGTTSGTYSDAEGNYSISSPENGTLIFSYIGFETREISVGGQTVINVKLLETTRALNEVVVTALGIKRETKALTYATQTIKGDDIGKTKDPSMINTLQGRVAGLTITRSPNGPGSDSRVLLRGNRSITGNNEPLYVTDGVPGSIGLEDGDNIESITVLKGASAAALYGSAGQNGAIIITTKKGVSGKITVTYNGGLLFDQAQVYQDFQYDYGQGDAGMYVPNSEHSFGPKNTGQDVTLWNGNKVPLTGQPGRIDDFFRTGMTLNNSISVNGGTEKMQTYFSYGNITSQGIMRNNDLIRHMFNLRISNNITSKLSFDLKATYINEAINNAPNDYAVTSIYRAPTSIPLDQMKSYEYTDINGDLRQSYWKPGSSIIGNPYYYMYRNLSYNQDNQLTGLFSAKYSFTKWLDLMVRGSITKSFGRGENKIYSDSYFSLVGSDYSLSTVNDLRTYADVLLTFSRKLNSNFTLSGNIGGSIQGSKSNSSTTEANGLNKDNFFFMSNAKAPLETNTYGSTPQVQALYAEATLGYKDLLFLDVTGRNDWSSALPEGSYSIFYPSIGLTGIISDMVELPSWINYGKARISIANSGYGGNAYLGREYYSVAAGGLIVTPTIQSFGTYKPEMTSSLEAGLTWNFLANRLGIDLTYYRTQTKNQLLLIGAPPASTYNQRYINAGLIQNSGLEAMLNFTPVKAGKFTWDGYVNYARNDNKVVRITDEMSSVIIQDDDIVTTKVEAGKSFGTLYVKGWQRDEEGRKLVDDMGRPLLTPGKTVYAGNYNPDYQLGFSSTFRLGDFSFGFLINHAHGGTILGGTQALIDADGHSARSLEGRESGIVLDAYQAGGGKNDQVITSQEYFSSIGDRKPAAEEYAYSATNTRLREVSFGYVIPKRVFGEANYISNIRISLIGRNLFFFKKSTPFDPDIAQGRGGIEATALPFARTMGVNVKVTF